MTCMEPPQVYPDHQERERHLMRHPPPPPSRPDRPMTTHHPPPMTRPPHTPGTLQSTLDTRLTTPQSTLTAPSVAAHSTQTS